MATVGVTERMHARMRAHRCNHTQRSHTQSRRQPDSLTSPSCWSILVCMGAGTPSPPSARLSVSTSMSHMAATLGRSAETGRGWRGMRDTIKRELLQDLVQPVLHSTCHPTPRPPHSLAITPTPTPTPSPSPASLNCYHPPHPSPSPAALES